jgi:hypothetical protein
MRIRERLARAWGALRGVMNAPSGTGAGPMVSGGPFHPDAYGAKRAPTPWELVEKYKSILFFCVNLNASRVASIPLRLYAASGPGTGMAAPRRACGPVRVQRTEQLRLRGLEYLHRSQAAADEIHEVTNHPFIDLLDQPDPDGYFDRTQLIDLICRYIDVVGTSYHKPVDYGAFPEELWPLQSQYVTPVRLGNTAFLDKYTYFAENYPFKSILRIRLRPSLHDPYGAGYAGAQAAVEYLGLEDQWVSIQSSVLGAGPRMGMIISSDGNMPIGKDEGEKLEREMNAKFARGGAGRVWVNKTGLKAQPITYPPSDLGGLEVSDYNLERACNCLDCPPTMFSKEQNLANIQAARELHSVIAVEPRCKAIASALTRFVRRYDPRLFVAFDPAVKEDEEHKVKVFDLEIRNGTMTRAEARAERGRPAYEGSEIPLVAGGLGSVPGARGASIEGPATPGQGRAPAPAEEADQDPERAQELRDDDDDGPT